jgi:hypothetical protein
MNLHASEKQLDQLKELFKSYDFNLKPQGQHKVFKHSIYSSEKHGWIHSFEFKRWSDWKSWYRIYNEIIVTGYVSPEVRDRLFEIIHTKIHY